jgi:hypothetical protein
MSVSVALFSRNAKRLRHFVTYGLSGSIIFSILSHKRRDFPKKKKYIEHKTCVLIFCACMFETLLILRIQRDIIINVDVFMSSTRYSSQILIKVEVSQQLLDRY